jgi:BlaI family penicillinase repressor
MSDMPQLSKRERQIMDIIYAHGEVTASKVLEVMPEELSRAAVRTFLRILEDKGHLAHRQEGREYVFRPTQPRGQMGQSAIQRVVDVFFSGSLEQAVAAYLADKENDIDPDELAKMAALIRAARKQGR